MPPTEAARVAAVTIASGGTLNQAQTAAEHRRNHSGLCTGLLCGSYEAARPSQLSVPRRRSCCCLATTRAPCISSESAHSSPRRRLPK